MIGPSSLSKGTAGMVEQTPSDSGGFQPMTCNGVYNSRRSEQMGDDFELTVVCWARSFLSCWHVLHVSASLFQVAEAKAFSSRGGRLPMSYVQVYKSTSCGSSKSKILKLIYTGVFDTSLDNTVSHR